MAWHWAQTLDQQQAEESNTGGFRHRHWRHHTSKAAPPQPQRQSGPRHRGEELSSTIDSGGGESASFYEALTGARERWRGCSSSRLDWLGDLAAGPAAVLSNLCRATATTALQLEATGPQPEPSPPSALSEGPSRHVQLKNNFATPSCAILLQNFFGTKSTHHPAGTSPTVRGRKEEG